MADPQDKQETPDGKAIVEEHQKVNRRAFMRVAFNRAGKAVVSLAAVHEAIGLKRDVVEWLPPDDRDSQNKTLSALFGPGDVRSASLVPAANHKWKTPPKNMDWYPLDGSCADAYRERFFGQAIFRTVKGDPYIAPDDSIGLFGSQISNLCTREWMGAPQGDKPVLHVSRPGWSTRLWWNLLSPAGAAVTERQQFGVEWHERNHHFVGSDGNIFAPDAGTGWITSDHLLVTALPRDSDLTRRVVIFAGCHGEGTLATRILLETPSTDQLKDLFNAVRGERFYQALFRVEIKKIETGEFRPSSIQLLDARTLPIQFSKA